MSFFKFFKYLKRNIQSERTLKGRFFSTNHKSGLKIMVEIQSIEKTSSLKSNLTFKFRTEYSPSDLKKKRKNLKADKDIWQ